MEGRHVKHILTPASQGFKLETVNQSYGQVLLKYMYACTGEGHAARRMLIAQAPTRLGSFYT